MLQRAPIENGATVVIRVGRGPFGRWVAEHRDVEPGRRFRDIQVEGPFARFEHEHRFDEVSGSPDACRYVDRIDWRLPFEPLSRWVAGRAVERRLARSFRYRHAVVRHDLAADRKRKARSSMRIAITGAGGLVGAALVPLLTTGGDAALRLVRREPAADDEAHWDPSGASAGGRNPLDGVDAVVHLAGESIAEGRWNDAKKARIRDSRVKGTDTVARLAAAAERPPRVLVCASAIGVYGNRGDEELTEASAAGDDFLAGVCRDWEAAAEPARAAGIRVVHLRFGVILSTKGGALAKMLPPFRLGGGGVLGSGRQWMSWVSLEDAIGAVRHALDDESASGPVNVVAPVPVTNREFTKTLGRVLGRPTVVPMPAFAARLMFGEMADALLLASQRVQPERLAAAGFEFRHPDLESALRHTLGR